jgi:hypothetical protein
MSNLRYHAELELKAINAKELYDGMVEKAVLDLIDVFADQGHSGLSTSIVIGLFEKLALLKPLSPLTGEDDEWTEVSDGVFQNKRAAFEERAARALIFHGGDNVVRKYETHYDGDMGEWGLLVMKVKQDLQGHFDAEIINAARFEIG